MAKVELTVWLRDVLCSFDDQHRPGQDAGIRWWAVAGIGEAPVLRQALADDLLGRAPVQHALPAGVVGRGEARQQPPQGAVAGGGTAGHRAPPPRGAVRGRRALWAGAKPASSRSRSRWPATVMPSTSRCTRPLKRSAMPLVRGV